MARVLPVPERLSPLGRANVADVRFKKPEAWLSHWEQVFRHIDVPSDGAAMDVVVGIDFGTSFTKVAVGMRDNIFPVNWSGTSANEQELLLHSGFSERGDGSLLLGFDPSVGVERHHGYLKQAFLSPNVSPQALSKAAIFLALVLRYVFAWLYHRHKPLLSGQGIRWMLNIGAPSNGLEHGELEATYKKLARMAWTLGWSRNPLRLSEARALVDIASVDGLPEGLFALDVIPEFVAQMAGYVQSPQRTKGLHALADVGGGTLDIVTFNVHRTDGEDVFPFFVPQVLTLGTQMANFNRWVGAASACDPAKLPDELNPLLNYEAFASMTGLAAGHVFARDELLAQKVAREAKSVLQVTKDRRYRYAPQWRDGMRVFVTGGGAQSPLYRNAVEGGMKAVAPRVHLMPLPQHPKLSGFRGSLADYQRISVACGLALDAFSLGQIRPAHTVSDDVTRAAPMRAVERADREDYYPK